MNIKVESSFYKVRIFINGIIHLSIKKDEIISIQSWYNSNGVYFIEYQTQKTFINCEYDNKKVWESILRQLLKIGIA